MSMSPKTAAIKNVADEQAFIWRVAAECIQKIDAHGSIGCSDDGVRQVAEAMLRCLDKHHSNGHTLTDETGDFSFDEVSAPTSGSDLAPLYRLQNAAMLPGPKGQVPVYAEDIKSVNKLVDRLISDVMIMRNILTDQLKDQDRE